MHLSKTKMKDSPIITDIAIYKTVREIRKFSILKNLYHQLYIFIKILNAKKSLHQHQGKIHLLWISILMFHIWRQINKIWSIQEENFKEKGQHRKGLYSQKRTQFKIHIQLKDMKVVTKIIQLSNQSRQELTNHWHKIIWFSTSTSFNQNKNKFKKEISSQLISILS